jgi:hypothetical protein
MHYQLVLVGALVVALLYSFYVSSRGKDSSPLTDLLGKNSVDVRFNTYDYSLLNKYRQAQQQEPFRQHMMPVSVDTGYDVVGFNY